MGSKGQASSSGSGPAVENGSGGSAGSTQAALVSGVGSNPRNTAAGVVRSQNPCQTVVTQLSFLAYQLLCPPGRDGSSSNEQQSLYLLRSQHDSLQWLQSAGFNISKDAAR